MTDSIKSSSLGEVKIVNGNEVTDLVAKWAREAGSTMPWTWFVAYDGSFLPEYGEDGGVHAWGQVDLDRVRVLGLVPLQDGLNGHGIRFEAGGDRTPSFFRRFYVASDGYYDSRDLSGVVHCIGWFVGEHGGDNAHYQFYFPDGSSVSGSDLQGV